MYSAGSASPGVRDPRLVSVILPTYNRADLLGGAIRSVLAQTYPHWELIVWDDGSTDMTRQVVSGFADVRIRYLGDRNYGAAYARNRAIEQSRGQYLAFLDSDDEWQADKLRLQVGALNSYEQVDVLFTDFLNVSTGVAEGRRTFKEYQRALGLLDVERLDDHLLMIRSGMARGIAVENFIATDTVILRRAVLDCVGCFDETLRNSMDFELWWRMSLADVRFAYIDLVCMTRRKLGSNLSGSSRASGEGRLRALDVCRQRTKSASRIDLIPALDRCYRNTWQNLITSRAEAGDWKGMVHAFRRSLAYGFSFGSLRLLLQGTLRHVVVGLRPDGAAGAGT